MKVNFQELKNNMKHSTEVYLEELRKDITQGLTEFSEHPVKYTTKTIGTLVRDYWDVGAAALAGFAFNDYGSEIFGEYRSHIVVFGALASIFGGGRNYGRLHRNAYAGLATFYYFFTRGVEGVPQGTVILNKTIGTIFGGVSVFMDYHRRRDKKRRLEKSQKEVQVSSLEDTLA